MSTQRGHEQAPVVRFVLPIITATGAVLAGWWMFETATPAYVPRTFILVLSGTAFALMAAAVACWYRSRDLRRATTYASVAIVTTIGSYRFLATPWVATLGAWTWFAGPLILLWAATRLTSLRFRLPAARLQLLIGAVLGAGMVVTSGPRHELEVRTSVRAASWFQPVYAGGELVFPTRQVNPAAWWPHADVVRALWFVWSLSIVTIVATTLASGRRTDLGRRRDRLALLVLVASAGAALLMILLGYPEPRRSPGDSSSILIDRWYMELALIAPILCAATLGGFGVWTEVVGPRLRITATGALQLDPSTSAEALHRRLVRTLGDPSLRVLYPTTIDDRSGWVDDLGTSVDLPDDEYRGTTVVEVSGRPVAALDHDIAVANQPELVEIAATMVGLTVSGRALAAVAEHEAADARASAERLVVASESERRGLAHRVEVGPSRRLAEIAALTWQRPMPVTAIHDGLRTVTAEVRTISRGEVPASLYEAGLRAALEDIADVAPIAMTVGDLPDDRGEPVEEATLVLVVADAVKRADRPIRVDVVDVDGDVVASITGAVGAPDAVLLDRIATMGGTAATTPDELRVTLPRVHVADDP